MQPRHMKEIPKLLVADLFSWVQTSVYQGTQTGMGGMHERGCGATRKKLPVCDPESAASPSLPSPL